MIDSSIIFAALRSIYLAYILPFVVWKINGFTGKIERLFLQLRKNRGGILPQVWYNALEIIL